MNARGVHSVHRGMQQAHTERGCTSPRSAPSEMIREIEAGTTRAYKKHEPTNLINVGSIERCALDMIQGLKQGSNTAAEAVRTYFLCRCRFKSFRCLCFRIFLRRFLMTLPKVTLLAARPKGAAAHCLETRLDPVNCFQQQALDTV